MRTYICDHGVPFDVAESAPDYWVFAKWVVIGESQGGYVWNWDRRDWDKTNG